jgi:hypothetical protein
MERAMKRRQFLGIIGGGVVLAATGAGAGYLATRRPDAAYRPWTVAGVDYQEPRRKALSYAILAPNPHNRQPWLLDLSTAGEVGLFVDGSRLLPFTDPLNRQITIGLGCFLEQLTIAAAQQGHRLDIALFPEGSDESALDRRPVARIRFVEDSAVRPDPLFAHILDRRSLKEPFDLSRIVPDTVISDLENAVRHGSRVAASNDMAMVETLRRLTSDALDVEINTPHTYKESVDLFRIGKAEIEANPDGIDLGGPMLDSLGALGQISRELALDPSSTAFAQGRDMVLANPRTAMGHVWLTTSGNSRAEQIATGRDWARINLAATASGIGIQPLSQALQEYPEVAAHYREVHKLLASDGGTVQMLGRLGYAASVEPSPRWPLEAKIM